MARAQEVIRNFKVPDAAMLQASRTFFNLFSENSADFLNIDPTFDDTFKSNWLTAIETAETAARDLMVQDELAILTQNVQTKLEECRTHYQKMKYYIEQAFPKDTAMLNAFGSKDYDKARKGEKDMIPFMRTVHAQAVKHADALIAVNFVQTEIDKIKTLADELVEADQAQELFKKNRLVITQGRINSLNNAWDYTMKVNRASKVVYAGNYAKLQQFLLPGESSSSGGEEVEQNNSEP